MKTNPVQLEEFVQNAIEQIMRAVAKAGKEVRAIDGEINPRPQGEGKELVQAGIVRAFGGGGGSLSFIEFDIAVTATKEEGRESGVGVLFAAIGAGMKEKRQAGDETVSRISFKIPVMFPHNDK